MLVAPSTPDRIERFARLRRLVLGPVASVVAFALAACSGTPTPVATVESPPPMGTSTLVVEVETARWEDEMLYVALFQDPETWLERDGWLVGRTVPVTSPVTTVVFEDVPARPTAISGFIDLERDENLTRNVIGLPTEPWGFSNDLSIFFRKPSFEDAMVEVADDETTVRFAIGTGLDRGAIRRARREAAGELER